MTHASWPGIVGDNLILSWQMNAATGWNEPPGSSIGNGKMNWTSVAAGAGATNDGALDGYLIPNLQYIYNLSASNHSYGHYAIAAGDEQGPSYGGNGQYMSEVLTAAEAEDGCHFRLFNPGPGVSTLAIDEVTFCTYQQMGSEGSWNVANGGGRIRWVADGGVNTGILIEQATSSDTAGLIGGDRDAFDALNTTSTAGIATFKLTDYSDGLGDEQILFDFRVRGGSWVTVQADQGATVLHAPYTSGTGNGFDFRGNDSSNWTGVVYLIRTALAS